MRLHNFIFSNKRRFKLSRHFCFWLGWFLFSGIVQISFNSAPDKDPLTNIGDIIFFQFFRSVGRFPAILMFCYFTVYFLVPKFIQKRKFVQFALWFFLSVLSLYALTCGFLYIHLEVARTNPYISHWPPWIYWFNGFYSNVNFTGAIPTCCLMLAIKYYKNWYIKQRRSEQLSRENIQAELQLLKAQVHPHFLFNTLNNIYSFVLNKDIRAAELVDRLAGMINYMRTEGEHSLVLLEEEITLIEDYIGLEQVRYGKKLNMEITINGDFENKMIAPLLMIPFIENSFKHGTSQMLLHPWIKLEITIINNQLFFNLNNSKPSLRLPDKQKKGIGLMNVKKRLALLYPGKHQLDISSTDDIFTVNMQLWLEDKVPVAENKLAQSEKTIVYAR